MADDKPAPPAADTPDPSNQWTSTKFFLASVSLGVGSTALFLGKFDPTSFLWLVGLVLGLHGSANIIDKKLNPGT